MDVLTRPAEVFRHEIHHPEQRIAESSDGAMFVRINQRAASDGTYHFPALMIYREEDAPGTPSKGFVLWPDVLDVLIDALQDTKDMLESDGKR